MKKIRLGRTNLEVTKWGLGGIPLSTVMGGNTEEGIGDVIKAALDYGINFIDAARIYFGSETNIGEAIKSRRDQVVLATKTINREPDVVASDIKDSLAEFQTDKIDIYQIHDLLPAEVESVMGKNGVLEVLKKAKSDGLIDFIGLTTHHCSVGIDLIKTGEFDTVMFPFNVIEREPEKELLKVARENDIGTIVMKPLAGGPIANIPKAFRFFNNYDVDLILNGISNLDELKQNLKCAEDPTPLTNEELKDFEKEVEHLGMDFCRRCNYCLPCPNDLIISPFIHVIYQIMKGKNYKDLSAEKKEIIDNMGIWYEACEECGQCEEKCPYDLPTIKRKNALLEFCTTKTTCPQV